MITRVLEIRGIGCLKNMRPGQGSEYAFGKQTVIFAPNAVGKTTLAAVLKSYGADDPILVSSRATLSARDAPSAVVEVEGKPRRFQNGAWHGRQDGEGHFAVFDHAFIEENVFSSEVTPDHLKTIHRVVIGQEGSALSAALEQAKEKERDRRRSLEGADGCRFRGSCDPRGLARASQRR